VLTNIFFGPVAGFVRTTVDETELISQVAVVRVPQTGEEEGVSASDETLELLGGRVTFNRPGCIESIDPEGAREVELLQGRTRVFGQRFFLDRGTDIGVMDGPVSLTRPPANDANRAPLTARASSMTFDTSTEQAVLLGAVQVVSGSRVSEAERLELDEESGVALLFGNPAVSRDGSDEIRGNTLRYDLDTDEVEAIGAASATFEVEMGSRDNP
jgi:lipopolysaccharide export system protein LptA